MKKWLIYKHTSMKSGKSYVGLTSQSMEVRWKQHISVAKHGDTKHFSRAIRLYGNDNWEHKVLVDDIDTLEEACVLEKYYIKKYDTFENGYNLTLGGEGTQLVLPEFIFYNPELDLLCECTVPELATTYGLHQGYVRYVAQGKAKHCNGWFLWEGSHKKYDKQPIYSFEHKEHGVVSMSLKEMADTFKLSKGNLSMVVTSQRKHTKGWTLVGNQEKLTEEFVPGNAKKVGKYQASTGELVATYPSINHAARENGVTESVVGDRCRGRCATNNINGFTYKYIEE